MRRSISVFLEGIVTLAIVMVLLQTLLEDILVLTRTDWSIRRVFIFTGFAFDLFFTTEFLTRSWIALGEKRFGSYFFYNYGWVDFVASVPLLMLTSAPELIAYLSGAAFSGAGALMGMLKVVKAVRIARVLRLLRLLRLFQRIRFTDSHMVQRHMVRIITTIATAMICTNMLISATFTFANISGVEQALLGEQRGVLSALRDMHHTQHEEVRILGINNPMILMIKSNSTVVYEKDNQSSSVRYYGPGDYAVFTEASYTVWFDAQPYAAAQSRLNLTVFAAVLMMISALMLTYGPHFALTVSDPVNVMMRGMKEKSYNLEVRINRNHSTDEIYRFAEIYNDEFLPMKARSENNNLDISIDDISDLLEP